MKLKCFINIYLCEQASTTANIQHSQTCKWFPRMLCSVHCQQIVPGNAKETVTKTTSHLYSRLPRTSFSIHQCRHRLHFEMKGQKKETRLLAGRVLLMLANKTRWTRKGHLFYQPVTVSWHVPVKTSVFPSHRPHQKLYIHQLHQTLAKLIKTE